MKRKSLLIMLLVALFVPLAMNGQRTTLTHDKSIGRSPVSATLNANNAPTAKAEVSGMNFVRTFNDRGNRAPQTSTVTASKITSSSVTWTGSAGETWNVTITGGATNQNVTNGYAQYGTRNSKSTSGAFSTSGISGTITSVAVDCASYNGLGTVSVTVGGAAFGSSQSIPRWNNNAGGTRTFTGSASGEIVVTMTNASNGRAMYIKSITVTYELPSCDPESLPYSYGFEDESEFYCWSVLVGNEENGCGIIEFGDDAYEGSNIFAFSSYEETEDEYAQILISPELNTTNPVDIEFYYNAYYAQYADEYFTVGYSTTTNDYSAFTWSDDYVTADSDEWTLFEASFPAGTKYVAIYYLSEEAYYLLIDAVTITEGNDCVKPKYPEVSNITRSSAELSWTAGDEETQWQLCLNGNENNLVLVNTDSYDWTGLTPETEYTFKVRAYCDATHQSVWSHEISFTTAEACPAPSGVIVSNVTPNSAHVSWAGNESYDVRYATATITGQTETTIFSDGFESGIGNNWTIYTEGDNLSDYGITDGWFAYTASELSQTAHGGTVCAFSCSWMSSALDADNYLVSPQVELGSEVRFWVKNNNYGDEFEVLLSTTGNAIQDFTVELQGMTAATNTWTEVSLDISRYAGQQGYIAIHHEFSDGQWLMIDDFGVYKTDYTYSYGTWNYPTASGNSCDLTGLSSETLYVVEVKADCGTWGESDWSTDVPFTTLSSCIAPTGLSAQAMTNSATLGWTGYVDTYNVQYREVDPTEPATLILNVPTDIWNDGTGYQLVLDADHNTYGTTIPTSGNFTAGSFADFEYTIPANAECNASTNTIIVANTATITIPAGVYDYVFLNPDPSSGTYYIASDNGFSSRGDDFEFEAGKTYEFTLSLVDSHDYITLNTTAVWTPVSGAVSNPYTLTGLNTETTYEWQVKGNGCDDWSTNAYFTTLNGILVESISADDVTVVVGATATITATVLPADATNPAVTYTSANTEIATVNGNVVTGVAPGNTTITIAATDGSNVSTTINVTVAGIDVTGITADDVTVVNGQTATISYTVAPANASDQTVTFTSTNTAIATVDAEGVVTGVAVGTTTITIASVSNPEVTAEINVTVTSDPNAVQFTVDAPATAHPGDVITVAGVLTAPTNGTYGGFTDLLMSINYDHNAFEFVNGSIVYGPVIAQAQQYGSQISNITNVTDKIQVAINCSQEGYYVTAEGVVFSAQFTVLAETGEFTFTGEPNGYMNFDHEIEGGGGVEYILYEATPSTVEVTALQTFTKTIIGYATAEGNGSNYYLIASPLADEVDPTDVTNMITDNYGAEVTPDNSTYDFYSFDQAQALEWVNYRVTPFNMVNGQGYLYASKEGTTLTFTGVPYSGTTKVVTLNKTAEAEGLDFPDWNLVGNPFAVDEAYIGRPFYRMEEGGVRVLATEQTGAIQPMEGVFVVAAEDGEEMTFTTQAPGAKASIILNLNQGRGNTIDRAIVSVGQGRTLPKFMFNPYDTKMYMPQNGEDYAVVRSLASDDIPVSFEPAEDGYFNISVDVRNLNLRSLVLKDKVRNVSIDLLRTPTYQFKASIYDRTDRFLLTFRTTNGIYKEKIMKGANSEDFGFFSYGNWVIDNEGEATLQVIDLNGRVLSSENIYGSTSIQVDVAPGVYMLRLINGDNVKIQKVVVE